MGRLILPRKKPIKTLGKPIWFSNIETRSGQRIKRYMPEEEARMFTARTGFPVYRKMKKHELDKL